MSIIKTLTSNGLVSQVTSNSLDDLCSYVSLHSTVNFFYFGWWGGHHCTDQFAFNCHLIFFFNWVGGEVTIAQISLLSAVSFLYILVGWSVTIAQVVQKCSGSSIFMFVPVLRPC